MLWIILVNKPSVASFFEANWGGLHQMGHGYQGILGNDLGLGEVSNNIFAYYVQTDSNIYPFNDRFLGALHNDEERQQTIRLQGGNFDNLDLYGKLHFLISLFESIDSVDTYKNIFKFFREKKAEGINFNNGQDVYVIALAEIYGLNLIPYFNAWCLYN